MSNEVNTNLLEEAKWYIEELSGTGMDKVMESNIAANDLEALRENMQQARNLLFDKEYKPGEVF